MTDMSQIPPSPEQGHVVDMRAGKRASLMIRSAKLICQSGEYPCIVRDVSSGGCKLRFFHAMPPETYVLLELANGETFAMKRVWNRDLEAGFQFTAPIDVEAFIEESSPYPRRPVRLRIRTGMRVWADGKGIEGVLRDIGTGGVGLALASELALRQPVRLALPGIPDCYARVAWRRGASHGLVFEQQLKMNELAQWALALQPFLPATQVAATQLFEELPQRYTA